MHAVVNHVSGRLILAIPGDSIMSVTIRKCGLLDALAAVHSVYLLLPLCLRMVGGCNLQLGCAEYALVCSQSRIERQSTCLQVEAYAALGNYREADAALQAAGRKSASFRETKDYKSLSSQLKAALQGSRR